MPIEIRFNCQETPSDYLTVDSSNEEKIVNLSGNFEGITVSYSFDIPTAIKLSKTIRTHINKVKGI